MRDAKANSVGSQYTIAIITAETAAFPDMKHFLAPKFKAALAQTEHQIQAIVADAEICAVLMDLDGIGEGPSDALGLVYDFRQGRNDLVLGAIARCKIRSIPLKASQAGADEVFWSTLD